MSARWIVARGGGALLLGSLFVLALSGCRPQLPSSWVSDEVLAIPPSERFAEAPAEVLYLSHKLVMSAEDDWYVQRQHHEVRRINDASGLDYANIVFMYDTERDELVDFRARTISPDGTRHELGTESLFVDRHGARRTVVSFRFPQVEVGSVLEYVYTVEAANWYYSWYVGEATGALPVRRYRLDVRGTDNIEHSLRVFNVPDEAVQRAKLGGWWRLTAAVEDVPAYDDEPFGPSAERGGVWYLYKTREINDRKVLRTWASETKRSTRELYEAHPWLDDFGDPFDAAGCRAQGVEACAAEVVASVHDATRLEDRNIWRDARPLGDVLASGTATSFEKAVLTWARLDAAGLEARYAFFTRDDQDFFDVESPHLPVFDHLLLYLPEQEGLDEALWIDPSCEWCAPGELPQGSDLNHAVIVRMSGNKFYAEPKRPSGRLQPAESTTRRTRVELDAAGNAVVRETVVTERAAAERRLRKSSGQSARELLEALDEELSERLVGQRDLAVELDCDRRAGRCTEVRSYEVPGYAIVDGASLHVPLTLLESPLESSFAALERFFPVILDERIYRHEVELVVPAGYVASGVPRDRATTAARGAVSTRLEFVRAAEAPLRVQWQMQLSASEHAVTAYPELRAAVRELVGLRGSAVTFTVAPPPQPGTAADADAAADAPSEPGERALFESP